jgi:hypothetical protein
MNLRETKTLQCGDKFRRPSRNLHDEGWRVYTVIARALNAKGIYPMTASPETLTVADQHGYVNHVSVSAWDSMGDESKNFMKVAERL